MLDAGELSQFDRWATGRTPVKVSHLRAFRFLRLYRIWRLRQFVKQGNRASEALDEGFEGHCQVACVCWIQ